MEENPTETLTAQVIAAVRRYNEATGGKVQSVELEWHSPSTFTGGKATIQNITIKSTN